MSIDRALPFEISPELYPFEHRFHELADGGRLHYVDEGPAEPEATFLLCHGNPTWSFLYRHILSDLRDRFRLIAVDYPGFGMSRAAPGYGFTAREHSAALEELVTALDLRELTLFVQDWGGPIGLGMGGRQPERIRRLVIGNTWAWPMEGDWTVALFSRLFGGPIGKVLIRERNFFVNQLLPRGVERVKLSREVMDAYRAPFPTKDSRLPTWVFPREILGARDYLVEVEAGLGALEDRATLLVWGNRDMVFRKRELQEMQRRFPHHRTVVLSGASHYIQEDAPEEICAAIRAW